MRKVKYSSMYLNWKLRKIKVGKTAGKKRRKIARIIVMCLKGV